MTHNDAKKIMRMAATFCLLGPAVIMTGFACRLSSIAGGTSTEPGLIAPIGIIGIGLLIITIYLVNFSIPLWRLTRPELLRGAISCGGSILFFFPFTFNANDSLWANVLVILWLPLWWLILNMLNQMARSLEPELAKAIINGRQIIAVLDKKSDAL